MHVYLALLSGQAATGLPRRDTNGSLDDAEAPPGAKRSPDTQGPPDTQGAPDTTKVAEPQVPPGPGDTPDVTAAERAPGTITTPARRMPPAHPGR